MKTKHPSTKHRLRDIEEGVETLEGLRQSKKRFECKSATLVASLKKEGPVGDSAREYYAGICEAIEILEAQAFTMSTLESVETTNP